MLGRIYVVIITAEVDEPRWGVLTFSCLWQIVHRGDIWRRTEILRKSPTSTI